MPLNSKPLSFHFDDLAREKMYSDGVKPSSA
nr:MAG TPA: hypothetical protein [Caudoviricetes sp.]